MTIGEGAGLPGPRIRTCASCRETFEAGGGDGLRPMVDCTPTGTRVGRAPAPHPPGLAVCPVCTDLDIVRHLCRFCGGLGFVGREKRNAYKRGERP